MSVRRRNVVQKPRAREKKPPTIATRDSGSPQDNALKPVSSEQPQLTQVTHPGPPKINDLDGDYWGDPSLVAGLARAFGTNDKELITQLMAQVITINPKFEGNPDVWNAFLAALHGIGPRDTLEGLLAVQMVSVHEAAMRSLIASTGSATYAEADANTNRATKLLRTFREQMEALSRYRGKISPQMVIGNVNVNDGGQAIVGPVNHTVPVKQ